MMKRTLLKIYHSLILLTLKRLLLTISMSCLMTAVNAASMDDGVAAYNKGNYEEAAKLYRLSAAQGKAGAQYNLGVIHDNGLGVTQDYKEAVKWYRLSAEQGHIRAQKNLGVMYHNGKGVTQCVTPLPL